NIASPSRELREKSTEALRVELERCEALGIPSLVLHPGSHGGAGEEAGLARAARALDRVHRATRGFEARILLENAAGQGASISSGLRSIGELLRRAKEPERLGVCLDTCHLLAAGYEIRTPEGYEAFSHQLEREVGAREVRCIHANDSKRELGSRVDRHEHIGRGRFGRSGLRWIVTDPRFRQVPFISELPPEDGMVEANLAALRRIAGTARGRSPRRTPRHERRSR
ncbi:MAG: deoxyribonuclease IV, partial [Planctomycetes bacterium]|nr:deoxyribonuclease IV [Planctomycetota bacterium]